MGREQDVKVMPAKYRQGDDLLRNMLANAEKIQLFCVRESGRILRDKNCLLGPRIVCYM